MNGGCAVCAILSTGVPAAAAGVQGVKLLPVRQYTLYSAVQHSSLVQYRTTTVQSSLQSVQCSHMSKDVNCQAAAVSSPSHFMVRVPTTVR